MNTPDINIERMYPSGAWLASAIVHGRLVSQVYQGFTKREALADFRDYLRSLKD